MTSRLRRNGQVPSCEPCRKSKLRCDHSKPICGRCLRRGISEQGCYYHPAPMTKRVTTGDGAGETRTILSPSIPSSMTAQHGSTLGDTPTHELINVSANLMHFADPETLQSRRQDASLNRRGVVLPQHSPPSEEVLQRGVDLLNRVLDLVVAMTPLSLDPDDDDLDTFAGGVVLGQLAWKATRAYLRLLLKDRSAATLKLMAGAMFERSSQALIFPDNLTSIDERWFRWETIGSWCSQLGIYLADETDKMFHPAAHKRWTVDRKTLMKETFETCAQLEALCLPNDLTLWFLSIFIIFTTWCFGDDSYHVTRIEGCMSSVFLALGYHKGVHDDQSTPKYVRELRRQALTLAHEQDKAGATFTSRPCRLSRHFCTYELPLDLPDSVLMGTAEDFERALADLDDNGWSKNGIAYPVTRKRMLMLLWPVREEALELINGPRMANSDTRARRALRDLQASWQAIPLTLRREAEKDTASHLLRTVRRDYLYTEFLIYTLLTHEQDRLKLITTAHEVLRITLLPTRNRHITGGNRSNLEWALVSFAMPCASVLVLELLRQTQHPEEELPLARSDVIQNISVLIACCDSLSEPGQNNYEICKQAKSIFSRSLDSILNKKPLPRQLTPVADVPTAPLGDTTFGSGYQDPIPEWTAWLDSVGLQPEPWLDSMAQWMDLPMDDL